MPSKLSQVRAVKVKLSEKERGDDRAMGVSFLILGFGFAFFLLLLVLSVCAGFVKPVLWFLIGGPWR